MSASTSAAAPPFVVVVVLTWNDTEMTTRCLESVYASRYDRFRVVVVDNGSQPPAAPVLAARFPDLATVALDRNTGFTGGCNRGLERALAMDAGYVVLLNNDTVLHPDAIAELVAAMEANPRAGMASAVLLFPGPEKRIQFRQGLLRRDSAEHLHPGERETLDDGHRRVVETEFAPAAAVCFRPAALRAVGLFDESLFTNWEDYDLCCRLADGGWTILVAGGAEVVHEHGKTTGTVSPFITYFATRNRLICLFRHAPLRRIVPSLPRIVRTFYWQFRYQGARNWRAHRAMLRGFTHFLLGVRGVGSPPADRRDRIAAS